MSADANSVTARLERMTIPTYPVKAADLNPMFFEDRNIQGSKGNIYPHPFTDQLSGEKVDREYDGVILENAYLRLVLLPEIGGRIFTGLDKTNGYDFFYRHEVIKPALIGLFGPWISGGVEFNWPQHHRPGTFDPTDYAIEEHPDGSKTVWMGEHDPLNRTKGMVGICLHPGKAYLETRVRLYNRTPLPQTFLWWANAGVKTNDQFQVIFPPDVHHAVYHVKNPVISYPIAKGEFNNGLDYGEGTDISYWVNSPDATSFFAAESKYEFFGAYDHLQQAGVVHVADAGISPGKKYFTWANGRFGHQWQRNLMDSTGEYLELMAGVYTDNQPDFTWIMPYETKTFSQYWYPVQAIGAMKNANLAAAVNLEFKDGQILVAAYGVAEYPGALVRLEADGVPLLDQQVDLGPGKPCTTQLAQVPGLPEQSYVLRVLDASGTELIRYQPDEPWDWTLPEPYKAPDAPDRILSNEELYLIGLHLDQYRHPTIPPERYWDEALRRDPGDARVNVAMGKLALRRAELVQAEAYFHAAVSRLTSRNLNPYDGDAHYHLGLALQLQGKNDEAYKAFSKAAWTHAWQSGAYYGLAQIDCLRGNYVVALEHLERALRVNADHSQARNLKAAVLRRMGRLDAAEAAAAENIALDLLDYRARNELALAARARGETEKAADRLGELIGLMQRNPQTYLDIAFEYSGAGFFREAYDLLALIADADAPLYPLVGYTLAWLSDCLDEGPARTADWYAKAALASPDYCFPWRLEEITVLRAALAHNPRDARAAYYLGNLLYDKKQFAEAISLWKTSAAIEPDLAIPWRNLGLAAYNLEGDLDGALVFYEKALAANAQDPRLLLEYATLLRRKPAAPEALLELLESNAEVTAMRDDLIILRMALLNRLGRPEETLAITASHLFHAWEGGEGSVTGQFAAAHELLGRAALEAGDPDTALRHFEAGVVFPNNLGEDPGAYPSVPLFYYRGLALKIKKELPAAQAAFEQVLSFKGGLDRTGVFCGLALIQRGRVAEGRECLLALKRKALELIENPPAENYFYAGHPSPLFKEDPRKQMRLHFMQIAGLALLALGDLAAARSWLLQVAALDPVNLVVAEELKRI